MFSWAFLSTITIILLFGALIYIRMLRQCIANNEEKINSLSERIERIKKEREKYWEKFYEARSELGKVEMFSKNREAIVEKLVVKYSNIECLKIESKEEDVVFHLACYQGNVVYDLKVIINKGELYNGK